MFDDDKWILFRTAYGGGWETYINEFATKTPSPCGTPPAKSGSWLTATGPTPSPAEPPGLLIRLKTVLMDRQVVVRTFARTDCPRCAA